jgi:Uma2 family endonuclease
MEQAIDQPQKRRYTVSEYFAIDAASDMRHEYRDGEIIAMAGGTAAHSLIKTNIIRSLGNRLEKGPCLVYESDLRVKAYRMERYVYPDVFVVCGKDQFDPDAPPNTTIANPKLIVEVLSPGTELTDRSEKFLYYMRCETLEEYVLVSQDKALVEVYHRPPKGEPWQAAWSFLFYEGRDAVASLQSLQIDLPLGEVYAKVPLPVAVE